MISAMPTNLREFKRFQRPGTQIVCLACNMPRVVFGLAGGDTANCPRCGYKGWDYSDELDGFTQRAIVEGQFAGTLVERRKNPDRRTRAA
jgi:hypothetical protein